MKSNFVLTEQSRLDFYNSRPLNNSQQVDM